jgi:hypothetical protein
MKNSIPRYEFFFGLININYLILIKQIFRLFLHHSLFAVKVSLINNLYQSYYVNNQNIFTIL